MCCPAQYLNNCIQLNFQATIWANIPRLYTDVPKDQIREDMKAFEAFETDAKKKCTADTKL